MKGTLKDSKVHNNFSCVYKDSFKLDSKKLMVAQPANWLRLLMIDYSKLRDRSVQRSMVEGVRLFNIKDSKFKTLLVTMYFLRSCTE
jgi:hypothetical protein